MGTVKTLVDFCVAPDMCEIILFDCKENRIIFTGFLKDIPNIYLDYEIRSFDPINCHEEAFAVPVFNVAVPGYNPENN